MVLDNCDVCMKYWVSNGSNMKGYQYLASNRHIPMAPPHPTDNNSETSKKREPDLPETPKKKRIPDLPETSKKKETQWSYGPYLYPYVPVPPPADTSMFRQPDQSQSHNIPIPVEDQTPPDQRSMPPVIYYRMPPDQAPSPSLIDPLRARALALLTAPAPSWDQCLRWAPQAAALASDSSMSSQPDQSHNITIQEDPAMPTPTDQTSMQPAMTEPEQNHNTFTQHYSHEATDSSIFSRLYKAATTGDWESAKTIEHEVLKTAKIRRDSETALHVAVGCGPRTIKFVEELLKLDWTRSDLELTNREGHTALGIAANVGNLEAAKLLVAKNPNLPNISSEGYGGFPIHCAAKYGHKELLKFLHGRTENKAYGHDYGEKFFKDIMKAELYDVALLVIKRDKSVSKWGAFEGLNLLAENPSSFSFGRDTKFLKWFVEKCYPDSIIHEDSNTTWKVKLWKLCEKLVPPLNHTVKYLHAVKLVRSFCKGAESNFLKAGTSTTNNLVDEFKMTLLLAATNGIHEIIEEVTKICPDAMWFYEQKSCDIFRRAIKNRHPRVYNLLYELGDLYINTVGHSVDEKGKTMLHLAAKLAPRKRLNHISGAAMQMQHEVQWYKEIENLVPVPFRKLQNGRVLTRPRDVFFKSHKELMDEAKSWMKGTAKSCTISAALIATVVFAAAITVPGGNSEENGIPMFARNKAFTIFGIADALSLFTSCVSILMFLSILTSRYAEHDFLFALPNRLIIGLLALFVSITSMMVAFGATLYLVFGAHKLWILTSVGVSSFLPVAIFGYLQFSLLSEMISSTYGSGLFRSRKTSHLN